MAINALTFGMSYQNRVRQTTFKCTPFKLRMRPFSHSFAEDNAKLRIYCLSYETGLARKCTDSDLVYFPIVLFQAEN